MKVACTLLTVLMMVPVQNPVLAVGETAYTGFCAPDADRGFGTAWRTVI